LWLSASSVKAWARRPASVEEDLFVTAFQSSGRLGEGA
jgi:hypothetical protein